MAKMAKCVLMCIFAQLKTLSIEGLRKGIVTKIYEIGSDCSIKTEPWGALSTPGPRVNRRRG